MGPVRPAAFHPAASGNFQRSNAIDKKSNEEIATCQ